MVCHFLYLTFFGNNIILAIFLFRFVFGRGELGDLVDQHAVVGHLSLEVRMRPVGAPQHPVGRDRDERLRERDRVGKRRAER